MPRDRKLSETLGRIISLAGEWEGAIEERENCGVRFRAVCRLGQYVPDPDAEDFAEQQLLCDLLKAAEKEVKRLRDDLLDLLVKADDLILALASREDLPNDWSKNLHVLTTTLRWLCGCVESTKRPLYLREPRLEEEWNQKLDSLTQWHRSIKAYEELHSKKRNETDWRDVQHRLLELYDRGDPYTSIGDLAKRLGCAKATIQKAIKDSTKLKGWQARHTKAKGSPRASSLTAVVTDNTAQTAESDPSAILTDEDIDNAMRRLIEEAGPEEKARLNGLSEDERRTLVRVFYEQNLDQEPSPLEDDPPDCKHQRVVQHKRL